MKRPLIVISALMLFLPIFGLAEHQSYLRGLDIPRSIAKKLGFDGKTSMGVSCEQYFGSVDQSNILRGAPSMETGRVSTLAPDSGVLQQIMTDVDTCLLNMTDDQASLLASSILSGEIIEALCPVSGPTLCPPVGDPREIRLGIAGQVVSKSGYYKYLDQVGFSKRTDLQKILINDFLEFFVGPDELLLEHYTNDEILKLKEELRIVLVKKIKGNSAEGQLSSASLLGFMMKSILLREEFLRINH